MDAKAIIELLEQQEEVCASLASLHGRMVAVNEREKWINDGRLLFIRALLKRLKNE